VLEKDAMTNNTNNSPAAGAFDAPAHNRLSIEQEADAAALGGDDVVQIGCNYREKSTLQILIAVPLIYMPLFTLIPFAAVSSSLVYWHLRLLGGKNIKTYWDFVPDWITHRYTRTNQVTMKSKRGAVWVRSRLFWLFNCKLYCPLSVAMFSWLSYLVKLVENWWCPFHHAKKPGYDDARIDASFWHLDEQDAAKLHPDDRANPIWNQGAGQH
jgi:hypothetical protein